MKCNFCKETAPLNHLCFVQKPRFPMSQAEFKLICLDFETYTDPTSKSFIPYLAICHKICHLCIDKYDSDFECSNCKQRETIFYGENTESDTCEWLFFNAENKDARVFAHNGSSFDFHFLLHFLLQNGHQPQRMLSNGNRILTFSAGPNNVSLRDSFLFLPRRLADLPKILGFKADMAKSFFPYTFSRIETLFYVGPIPEPQFYDVHNLNEARLIEFEEFYESKKNLTFDFRQESILYCRQDVRILTRAIIEFRKLTLKLFNTDPWTIPCVTLANFCSYVYRQNYMPLKSVPIVPTKGYCTGKSQQSLTAYKMLEYIRINENKPELEHAFRGKEFRVANYRIDGRFNNELFEINGKEFIISIYFISLRCCANGKDVFLQ